MASMFSSCYKLMGIMLTLKGTFNFSCHPVVLLYCSMPVCIYAIGRCDTVSGLHDTVSGCCSALYGHFLFKVRRCYILLETFVSYIILQYAAQTHPTTC
jgi:hypothetical protein